MAGRLAAFSSDGGSHTVIGDSAYFVLRMRIQPLERSHDVLFGDAAFVADRGRGPLSFRYPQSGLNRAFAA
jgi:hypothetical protein